MAQGAQKIIDALDELKRPDLNIRRGYPKGAWAHCYYVSFHQPPLSEGPQHGVYPVFLLSTDYKRWEFVIEIAAASVGISGRGGWSRKRGALLIGRAKFLREGLTIPSGWLPGPRPLGPKGAFLHQQSGSDRSAARAYECGVVTGVTFDAASPPKNLLSLLDQAFTMMDSISASQTAFAADIVPRPTPRDEWEQKSAAITGAEAEDIFEDQWCRTDRNSWGTYERVTDRVGLGYDFRFPEADLYVEVKGFREPQIAGIRLTDREWRTAAKLGGRYLLCLVSGLDGNDPPAFGWLKDPAKVLKPFATSKQVLQVTWHVPRVALEGSMLGKAPEAEPVDTEDEVDER